MVHLVAFELALEDINVHIFFGLLIMARSVPNCEEELSSTRTQVFSRRALSATVAMYGPRPSHPSVRSDVQSTRYPTVVVGK